MERFFLELTWWVALVLIAYVYLGYPAVLLLLSRWRKVQSPLRRDDIEPTVSLIIAAHNEEQVIAQKLENSLALNYPKDKLEIIIVSDGSSDETAGIAQKYRSRGVRLVELLQNLGKASAQNEAVKLASGDILLFTDANVTLGRDSIRRVVRHFQDSTVGCVVGRVTYINEEETGISEGEGFYWRYELFLRRKESQLENLVAGSGPIFAVKRMLFEPLDPAISEDFFLPMKAAIKGYRTVYEPEAVSSERLFQVSPHDMFKTRVRTITLDTRSVFLCRAILNPFRYPLYAWGLISHKLLRWLIPYFLIVLFAVNLLLSGHPFYNLALALQIVFYVLALAGYLWQRKSNPPRILSIPFSFCLVNLAALVGVVYFVMGKKAGSWVPVR
jgi:cellulose synthase/poly-beta-1,6-N-acetylglucosamine synthase-like glycosyltransferase